MEENALGLLKQFYQYEAEEYVAKYKKYASAYKLSRMFHWMKEERGKEGIPFGRERFVRECLSGCGFREAKPVLELGEKIVHIVKYFGNSENVMKSKVFLDLPLASVWIM